MTTTTTTTTTTTNKRNYLSTLVVDAHESDQLYIKLSLLLLCVQHFLSLSPLGCCCFVLRAIVNLWRANVSSESNSTAISRFAGRRANEQASRQQQVGWACSGWRIQDTWISGYLFAPPSSTTAVVSTATGRYTAGKSGQLTHRLTNRQLTCWCNFLEQASSQSKRARVCCCRLKLLPSPGGKLTNHKNHLTATHNHKLNQNRLSQWLVGWSI